MTAFAYAVPEYEHALPTGRTILAHPACLELVNGEGAAEPLTARQVIEEHGFTLWICAGCGGNLFDPARTIGVTLDAVDEFAHLRRVEIHCLRSAEGGATWGVV